MKVIPKINGSAEQLQGVCRVSLPIGYQGDCLFAGQFPLEQSDKPLLTFRTDLTVPAEGYRLEVRPESIEIASWDQNGAFYGMQTLMQLSRGRQEFTIPCGVYQDAPRFSYRGFMIDSGRHFFPVQEIKRMVEQSAQLKLNVFHWHLSEDQGYRIESKKFPRLNEIGSWRTEEDGSRYGGFYTQEEIRDVVKYAEDRFVTVIPEIDLPGHTTAMVAAYPELSCSGKPVEVPHTWGIFPRILCAGSEKVYEFLYELLDEVCELFPAPWFHIGGDEAPKGEWKSCPHCQAVIQKEGLGDEEALQAWFTSRLVDYLNKKGKTVIGWNEILASGTLGLGAVAQYWTNGGAEYSAREIPKGRKFIFSNSNSFYLDYDPSLITMEGIYVFEPYIPGGEAITPQQVLGTEAPLWSERIETPERLEYMAFPRLAALAENAWTKDRDFKDFCERAKTYEGHWKAFGINSQSVEQAIAFDPAASAKALYAQVRAWMFDKPEEEVKARMASFPPKTMRSVMSPTFTDEQLEAVQQAVLELIGK